MLYQDVRPQVLSDIKGNEATIEAIQSMLGNQPSNRPHAILLFGPTGCGKTTIARILAKEFGSKTYDMVELNAANLRGIDTVRKIVEETHSRPMFGKSRTYVLDESHQFTSAAQEALLKVLEDCPEYYYFILCTTEPHNLIRTIRNRCTGYEVSPLSSKKMMGLLKSVCELRGFKITDDLLDGIIYVSNGSARTALVNLEKIKDIEDTEIVIQMLTKDTEMDPPIFKLCEAMGWAPEVRKKKWNRILNMVFQLDGDAERVRRTILKYLLEKMTDCKDEVVARDMAEVIDVLSKSSFYGGLPQLGALVVKACFGREIEQ